MTVRRDEQILRAEIAMDQARPGREKDLRDVVEGGRESRCPRCDVAKVRIDSQLVEERPVGKVAADVQALRRSGVDPSEQLVPPPSPRAIETSPRISWTFHVSVPGGCTSHHEGVPAGTVAMTSGTAPGTRSLRSVAQRASIQRPLRSRVPRRLDPELRERLLDDECIGVRRDPDDDARHAAGQEFDLPQFFGACQRHVARTPRRCSRSVSRVSEPRWASSS